VGLSHPELAGREKDVEKALQDPDRIVPTTRRVGPSKDELGYEHDTVSDTIRVWVRHDAPNQILAGTTSGYISTGYVVNSSYCSQVGAPIYVKGSTLTGKEESK